MDTGPLVVLLALVLLVAIVLLHDRSWRKKPTPSVVVIQEGRYPGEPKDGVVCSTCGRRFKHTVTVEEELVKCPFCGSEIE